MRRREGRERAASPTRPLTRVQVSGPGCADLGKLLERALFGTSVELLSVRGSRFKPAAWQSISLALSGSESVRAVDAEDAGLGEPGVLMARALTRAAPPAVPLRSGRRSIGLRIAFDAYPWAVPLDERCAGP